MQTKTTIIDAMNAHADVMAAKAHLKPFTVVYNFNHPQMGFQNSITVEALYEEAAIILAKNEIYNTYGGKMLKRFSFKIA